MISNISCSAAFFFFYNILHCKKKRKIFLSFCSDTGGSVSCMEVVKSPVNPLSIKEAVILHGLHDKLHSTGFQSHEHKPGSFFVFSFAL